MTRTCEVCQRPCRRRVRRGGKLRWLCWPCYEGQEANGKIRKIPASKENLRGATTASKPLVFGDPDSIELRGPVKVSKRRHLRIRANSGKWKRYAPIWQRIEGEWKRFRCRTCGSLSFRVIEQRDSFVSVECAAGHEGTCLAGFKMERPESEDEQ